MASGPITSWQIDGETVADFIFLGSKITADGDCSHEIKRHLLLGRKVITNLESIFKSRDITLVGFSRQEYCSRLSFPSPGTEPESPVSLALQVDSLPLTPKAILPLTPKAILIAHSKEA